jgi:hypothetical protein
LIRTISWEAARDIVNAYSYVSEFEKERLQQALNKSCSHLAPLQDPLLTDFAAHRWLVHAREEAYSDWLSWILLQTALPTLIIDIILGKQIPGLSIDSDDVVTINREYGVADEFGITRRTDIEVIVGNRKVALVEVKKTMANVVDPEQLISLAKHRTGFDGYVLLARDSGGISQLPRPFILRTWKDACLAIRRVVSNKGIPNFSSAALTLAFVGTVEQNLLDIPGSLANHLKTHHTVSSVLRQKVEDYLNGYFNER